MGSFATYMTLDSSRILAFFGGLGSSLPALLVLLFDDLATEGASSISSSTSDPSSLEEKVTSSVATRIFRLKKKQRFGQPKWRDSYGQHTVNFFEHIGIQCSIRIGVFTTYIAFFLRPLFLLNLLLLLLRLLLIFGLRRGK